MIVYVGKNTEIDVQSDIGVSGCVVKQMLDIVMLCTWTTGIPALYCQSTSPSTRQVSVAQSSATGGICHDTMKKCRKRR